MNKGALVLPAVAAALWCAAVGWPVVALLGALGVSGPPPETGLEVHRVGAVLATSVAWALAVAVGAALLGWLPGAFLARALERRGYAVLAAFMLAPVCLPAYVLFYAWWQAWPADSALHRWAVAGGHEGFVKGATVFAGLVCWAWPIVAWSVACFSAATPREHAESLLVDGAGPLRRLLERARTDGRGLILGGVVVALFVFNATTSFDIAQIYTVGFELRALEAQGAGAATITRAALPALIMATAGACGLWLLMGGLPTRRAGRPLRVGRVAPIATAVIWALTVALPMALFAAGLGWPWGVGEFLRLYGSDLANTVAIGLVAALGAALVSAGLATAWQHEARWVRRAADVQAVGWLIVALVPGTVVTTALAVAYNRPGLDVIYLSPAVLIVGYLARFAFVGALLGRFAAAGEPRALVETRLLDGATGLVGHLLACWPRLLAAGGAAGCIVGVLSLSDLSVAARLQPAGFSAIATDVLDAIHYQRPRVVMTASLLMLALGIAAGFGAVGLWWPLRRALVRRRAAGL